ncbi:MAG: T9SS type A sorting domain-containing protein [candidate division KSB1 bacterium]|nr:T9SS type A sorting domain-containing protein [candidate division KSB1 bacterium]
MTFRILSFHHDLFKKILCWGFWVIVFFVTPNASAQTGAAISANTQSGYKKSNQSKVFYYDSQWWALAYNQPDGRWYIWRYNGTQWAKMREVVAGIAYYCDVVVSDDTPAGVPARLYVLGSHHVTPRFWRLSYASGTWNKDAGYPVTLSNFTNADQGNPVSLVRAKNGDLWIFRVENNTLQARRSSDEGLTWSATINVKTGLTTPRGTSEAVAFTFNSDHYIGVAYGELDAAGSKFGFLRHRDGDPNTSWTDESSALTFFSSERASNQICMTTDTNNNIYLLTRNANTLGNRPRNTLYKRTSAGTWEKYKVNSTNGITWKSPAVAIDRTNSQIYVMGVNSSTQAGEYKTCPIGQEDSLDKATADTLFFSPGANFDDLSVPAANVDAISGLMVCGDNLTASDIWFRSLATGTTEPLIIGTVTVVSNQVNANATYTIPLTLSSAGALPAGSGTINFRFATNTFVPDAMSPGEVLISGTPATSVLSNSNTRQVTVVTPMNLSNNQSFSVVFNPGAGLLNPTTPNSYRVTAWTSAQPTQVYSPPFRLVQTTTTVTPATVTLSTNLPDSCANYTIAFNLGPHGRLLSGTSTFTVTFPSATTITTGTLSGVKVNNVAATAVGDGTAKTVTITLPASVALTNDSPVTLYLPSTTVCNPGIVNTYTLTVKTSVETTPVPSNPYHIAGRVVIGDVLVAPPQVGAPASYTIPLTLGSNGGLSGGVDVISFRFPAGTIVPNNMPANQITVDGVLATNVVSNNTTREVHVTVPNGKTLPNGDNFNVVFNTGAGLFNPATPGNYSLEAWTSIQSVVVTSPLYTLATEYGNAIAVETQSGYKKANQSKVFYHDGQWWALAFYEPEKRWYIWKYDGATWTRATNIDKGINYHWDVVLDSGTGKLYLFGSNNLAPDFRRYSYAGGTWTRDSGFPIILPDFVNADLSNPVSMVQAQNGDLWIFRIHNRYLQAKRSSDGGQSWSDTINVKNNLTVSRGTTDAVAFIYNAQNCVGVAYGEADTVGSKFGFLYLPEGAPVHGWIDESAALTFFGSERALNSICMTTDCNNNIYLLTRNTGFSGNLPRNTLYKRTNTGVWQKFKVNSTAAHNWKTPAIAIDANPVCGVIYVMGVDVTTLMAEYKVCLIGNEASLENAPVTTLFSGTGATFDDLSVPAKNVNAVTGLMVTADNTAGSDIWYRHIPISGNVPVIVNTVTLSAQEVNANAQYTIPLTLSSNGALAAGAGIINFRFPDNTFVPSNMAASAILVNGTPASSVIVNNITRQVSVTTPVNLPNDHSFSVIFTPAAGLLNPTLVDTNYKLTVWTSSQPTQVDSPPYSLVQATTTVTAATVVPFPTDADSMADYTVNFNLGGHGRLIAGLSNLVVKFGTATRVTHGVLNGVKVNSTNAAASGDSALRKVTVTVPASVSLTNNAAVTLFLSKSIIRNPVIAGNYTLTVATSVETTAVVSSAYTIQPNNALGAPIPGTKKSFDRNNQSKMFYHGGYWWVTAQSKADLKWYLWKFDGVTWSQNILIHASAKNRPDCVLDAEHDRAYILLPGTSTTYITRLKYSSGAWSIDSGYPYAIPDFAQSSDRGINLVRANNGNLWVFMISDSTLIAKRSADAGKTWSAIIKVKNRLNNNSGLTDAVAFSNSGQNYVGVGYAENSGTGAVYGFLRHKDAQAETLWTDETASIPQFAGTTADDHLSMAVHNNNVFMIVKTNGGGANTVIIGLLHRDTNGAWSQYPILLSNGWTRPTLAVDQTNNMLYVIGTREGGVKVGEMKKVAIGDYGALLSAPIDTIFMNTTDNFFDVSVAAHNVTSTMGLLVCHGNETRDELWYNLIPLGGGTPKQSNEEPVAQEPANDEDFEGVQVYPNPFNPSTSFRFHLKEAAHVKLQIFNLSGQLVRTVVDGDLPKGAHLKRWNGRNQNGYPVSSGVYLYHVQIGAKLIKGRIQMLK